MASGDFDPDAYLSEFNPDEYLGQIESTIKPGGPIEDVNPFSAAGRLIKRAMPGDSGLPGGPRQVATEALSAAQLAPVANAPLVGGAYSGALKSVERLVAGDGLKKSLEKGIKEGVISGSTLGLFKYAPIAFNQASKEKLGGTLRQGINKATAYIQSGKLSDKTSQLIENNPYLVFKPKDSWQETYNSAASYVTKLRSDVGKKIGGLKDDAVIKSIESNASVPFKSLADDIDTIASEYPGRDASRIFKKVRSIISDVKPKKSLDPYTLTEKDPMVGFSDLGKIKKGLAEMPEAQRVFNDEDTGSAASDASSGLVKRIYSKLRDYEDNVLQQIDSGILKAGLKDARSEYANLMRTNRRIGNLIGDAPKNIGGKLQRVFKVNSENEFDDLREILPDNLFKKVAAHVIDQGASKLSPMAGLTGAVAGGIGNIGGAMTASLPEYAIGSIGTNAIKARQALGRGLAASAAPISRGAVAPLARFYSGEQ